MIKNLNEEGVAFGLGHIKGVGQSAIQKITDREKGSLEFWNKFLMSVPGLHRNVGIALVKSGACDCYGLSRNEMIKQLDIILGTTTRDENGKKKEIKGLTLKERDFVFQGIQEGQEIKTIFEFMSQDPDNLPSRLKDMKKPELVDLLDEKLGGAVDGSKCKKGEIIDILKKEGYQDPIKSPCTTKRREIIAEKLKLLSIETKDTNVANATAEKYFLGIALSCSAADDVNKNSATHTCLDIAKENNGVEIKVCAVIEKVKHTKTKKGKKPGSPMCFLNISDSTYAMDRTVVFPDIYQKFKKYCKEDLMISGEKKNGSFIIKNIEKLI
jgi:DNA polymerase III alpha subunit